VIVRDDVRRMLAATSLAEVAAYGTTPTAARHLGIVRSSQAALPPPLFSAE